jgi:hypothetical protein
MRFWKRTLHRLRAVREQLGIHEQCGPGGWPGPHLFWVSLATDCADSNSEKSFVSLCIRLYWFDYAARKISESFFVFGRHTVRQAGNASAAKAGSFAAVIGTAEAVPSPNSFDERQS